MDSETGVNIKGENMAIQSGQRTTRSKSSKPKKAAAKKKASSKPKAEVSTAAAVAATRVSPGDEYLATGVAPDGKRFKVTSVKDGIAVLNEVTKSEKGEELPVPVENLQDSESWVAV